MKENYGSNKKKTVYGELKVTEKRKGYFLNANTSKTLYVFAYCH